VVKKHDPQSVGPTGPTECAREQGLVVGGGEGLSGDRGRTIPTSGTLVTGIKQKKQGTDLLKKNHKGEDKQIVPRVKGSQNQKKTIYTPVRSGGVSGERGSGGSPLSRKGRPLKDGNDFHQLGPNL